MCRDRDQIKAQSFVGCGAVTTITGDIYASVLAHFVIPARTCLFHSSDAEVIRVLHAVETGSN